MANRWTIRCPLTIPRRWCCPGQGSYPFAADTWPGGQSCQIQQCATSQLVRLKKCKVEDDIVFWGDGDGVILRIVIMMNMMVLTKTLVLMMMKNDEDYDAYCCLLKRWNHRPFSLHTGRFILNFQLEYKTRRKLREQIGGWGRFHL